VPWTVTKRFLKSPPMEVRGPSDRSQASQHMQVILLTCHELAFRHMTGTKLVL
jgi:hypothetical protein